MSIRGWVYIISNQAMPGLIKIGYSTKDPTLRAGELNNTGAPHPYVVLYDVLVTGPREIEQRAHKELKLHSVGKEWFSCSVDDAVSVIRRLAAAVQISESPFVSSGIQKTNEVEKFGPFIQVHCSFCGETNKHPDSHIVYCPRCKRSIFTRSYERS
jgi:hypothetical protein